MEDIGMGQENNTESATKRSWINEMKRNLLKIEEKERKRIHEKGCV